MAAFESGISFAETARQLGVTTSAVSNMLKSESRNNVWFIRMVRNEAEVIPVFPEGSLLL